MGSLHKNTQSMLDSSSYDFVCNIAMSDDDTTLYSKRDQASDLWQQLELSSELDSDLRDTVDWDKK